MKPKKSSKSESISPKRAVLLLGSGYGALKVAEDMALSGIPVVWVTKARHFLELPRGIQSFSEWPDDLNFQFRPLYLRVTRHPLVTTLTRAHIESIDSVKDGFKFKVVQNPQYVDYDLCTGCGRCIEICPLKDTSHPPLTRTPNYCPSRALDLDKRKLGACRVSCPLGVNVQAYMALAATSRFDEALEVIRKDNPLPGICGRVCHHPCEASCRRSELDESVAICDIKRFLADREANDRAPEFAPPSAPRRAERVAVIGSGPAGLTAAHYLNQAGFPVTIFEALPEAGGMLRAGINAFRLSRKVLDAEIEAIEKSGVAIRTNANVDSIDELLKRGFKAALIATGAHRDLKMQIPGEDAEGVFGAVSMLRELNIDKKSRIGKNVAVIGGGNSAMDAARASIRLGADKVTVYYRREHNDMPATKTEIEQAEEEGVKFELLTAPVKILCENGKVTGLELIRMKLGEIDSSGRARPDPIPDSEYKVEADTVIAAVGQTPHLAETGLGGKVKEDSAGRIVTDDKCSSSCEGVFAAGDVVTGPSTVVGSMSAGRKAAYKVIEYLTGEPSAYIELSPETRGVGEYVEISEETPQQGRPEMPQRQPRVRKRDFEEVDLGLSAEQVALEAKRCLQCSSCCECRVCESVCADIGAIDHFRSSKTIEVSSPAMIVADAGELPDQSLLEKKNVYHIGDFSQAVDLMNVLVAGSAAAGDAMSKSAKLRKESPGREIAIEKVSEGAMRLGVFICDCNGAMAPEGAMKRIIEMTDAVPGVEHSELIFSACHPRGAEMIAKAVSDRRLSRVILASCVCCPLEFECISCNDQRTRARIHLFDRLGLDRNNFEMFNIKDHLYTGTETEDEIVERARYLLRQAYIRAQFIGPLRRGSTEIGKHILVLGGSELGLSCASNLDMQGFKVRLVHRPWIKGNPPPISSQSNLSLKGLGKNIIQSAEAEIEEIRGHVGDFTVIMNEGGEKRRHKVDMICLTDENVISLAINEDMIGLKKFYRYDFKFFHTPQAGLYRVMPRTLNRVNAFEAGAALAAQVATAAAEAFLKDHELSPVVDPELCRGCGRCAGICPFDAIKMVEREDGIFVAEVLRHNCVGCGGCVGRCPVTAMDMPYFSNKLLQEIVQGTLAGDR